MIADPRLRVQASRYLGASIVGTLVNFVARFPLGEVMPFELSVILANYLGMALVFALSYRRAFGVERPDWGMGMRFALVAHIGLMVVWLTAVACQMALRLLWPALSEPSLLAAELPAPLNAYAAWGPRLGDGFCHGVGIVVGFFSNFFGHREYSFRQKHDAEGRPLAVDPGGRLAARAVALFVPLAYLVLYAPYGMDSTDFGFFYGHPWRILQGEVPFRDFYYTKPPASLYWHAFWLWLTPEKLEVLAGKAGFLLEMLAAAWLGTAFLRRGFDFERLGLPAPLLATAGFVYGVHSFPAMPWHTADGVLAGAACLWLAAACGQRTAGAALAGLVGAVAVLTKQSFLMAPLGAACVLLSLHGGRRTVAFFAGMGAGLGAFVLVFKALGAWEPLLRMITGGLSLHEALEAGVFIYLRQDWSLLGFTALLWALAATGVVLWRRVGPSHVRTALSGTASPGTASSTSSAPSSVTPGDFLRTSTPAGSAPATYAATDSAPAASSPTVSTPRPHAPTATCFRAQLVPCFFVALMLWYVYEALSTRSWIGYGASWPTLLVLLGGVCVLLPRVFLDRYAVAAVPAAGVTFAASVPASVPSAGPDATAVASASGPASAASGPAASGPTTSGAPLPIPRGAFGAHLLHRFQPSLILGAALLLAWSTGISGGYKSPVFFSVPLLFAAVLLHTRLGGRAATAAWIALVCGLIMFRAGYEYPYVFPVRPLSRADLSVHAGAIIPRMSGVLIDRENAEMLRELKALREKYGPNYKTLPAFPQAYYLLGDKPALNAEWLQDWEIANDVDKVYQDLVDRDVIVFFERSQLDTLEPDRHARTRYSVPARVRQNWRQIDATPHFVVLRRPD